MRQKYYSTGDHKFLTHDLEKLFPLLIMLLSIQQHELAQYFSDSLGYLLTQNLVLHPILLAPTLSGR